MEDVREVSAELHRLADDEPLQPLDTMQVLERGRRGRRRRRLLGAGGAAAGVAAVALAVSLVPNLIAADKQPTVAGSGQQSASFEPVPGVPRGEEAADQRIKRAEAERRCALQNPQEKRPLQPQTYYRVGDMTQYQIKSGQQYAECTVPGGDRPTAATIAAAAADPFPRSTADQLLKCSVQSWIDLTGWRVVASARSDSLTRSELLAVSPSGRKLVACGISKSKTVAPRSPVSTAFFTLDRLGSSDPILAPATQGKPAELFVAGGGGLGSCTNDTCSGYNWVGWGRVPNATEVRLSIGNGPVTKVPVKDGWFAFTWEAHNKYDIKAQPKGGAYDQNGKLIRSFP
ncbi:hypothetical protein [Kribbella sp. NPDC004536]|uniref:hypothetical protein n=1 Tax=Kribbella sp. NPDC004536 TaxID=3364106 RepID=UPI003694EFE0